MTISRATAQAALLEEISTGCQSARYAANAGHSRLLLHAFIIR